MTDTFSIRTASADDVPRIVEETVVNGRVLEDLLIPAERLNVR